MEDLAIRITHSNHSEKFGLYVQRTLTSPSRIPFVSKTIKSKTHLIDGSFKDFFYNNGQLRKREIKELVNGMGLGKST